MDTWTPCQLWQSQHVDKVAKYSLLVVRQKEDGKLGCSRPCTECGKWLTVARYLGIEIRVYHVDDGGVIVLHDGHCCKYKAYESMW